VRVYRPTYKAGWAGKDGQKHKSATWWLDFTDGNARRWRFPVLTDKRQTEAVGRNVEKLIACKMNREPLDPALTKWVEGLPAKLRQSLGKAGLLSAGKLAAMRPLAEHVDGTVDSPGWRQHLMAKGNTAGHVDTSCRRVMRVLEGCSFVYWSDINANKVESHLYDLRTAKVNSKGKEALGMSAQTSNHHLTAIKGFCKWMVKAGRASESPLVCLDRLNAKTDRRHERRALEIEEVRWLLDATRECKGWTWRPCNSKAGRERSRESLTITGAQRAMLYRLAVETGLRANELASLTVGSFDFVGTAATVTVEAKNSKHRRKDVLPLRPDTAADLREFVACKLSGAKVFTMPASYDTAEMFRADLAAARTAWLNDAATPQERQAREERSFLAYQDSAGRYVDFHALRHTAGSLLAAAQVHPKVAQAIMRHGDINLTMSLYTHTYGGQEADAVAALPSLDTAPARQSAKATGTDNIKALQDAIGKARTSDRGRGGLTEPQSLSARSEGILATAANEVVMPAALSFAMPNVAALHAFGELSRTQEPEREKGNALDMLRKSAVFKGNEAIGSVVKDLIPNPIRIEEYLGPAHGLCQPLRLVERERPDVHVGASTRSVGVARERNDLPAARHQPLGNMSPNESIRTRNRTVGRCFNASFCYSREMNHLTLPPAILRILLLGHRVPISAGLSAWVKTGGIA